MEIIYLIPLIEMGLYVSNEVVNDTYHVGFFHLCFSK